MSNGPPPDTHESLMRAAFVAPTDHGYADLTLRKIAAEFEMSRGLVHYHYDSKDGLIVALLESLSDRFASRIEATADDPPTVRLDTLLEWLALGPTVDGVDGAAYHVAMFELRAQAPYNEALRARLQENFSFLKTTCDEIIGQGIRAGQCRPVDVEMTTVLLLSAVANARDIELAPTRSTPSTPSSRHSTTSSSRSCIPPQHRTGSELAMRPVDVAGVRVARS